ncbi:MAG: hypothetical protein EXR14_00090 [Pelagibacteraceae bacterium]|nr:hypothetical protein [Pelagibacteraceae bacterium]
MYFKFLKLLVIASLIYQSPLYSKSISLDDFNSKNLSDYFSGIVAFENRKNSDALKFFNSSKNLLNKHDLYLKRYVYALVLDNKILQAIDVLKNNSQKDNINFFDAYLLLIADSLKKNDFEIAEKYLIQSSKFINEDKFEIVVFNSLRQFIYLFEQKKLLADKENSGNLALINKTFSNCYLNDEKTNSYFLNLINNNEGDYSRYIFFYISYLIDNKKIDEANLILEQLDFINSNLLLLQAKNWMDNKKYNEFKKVFSCNNHNDIISEFLFLISNLYSSSDNFEKSNFYINLSIYLNPKFKFNYSLVAENFYINEQYDEAKKILINFNENDEFYYWYRIKKEADIIVKQKNKDEGLKYISSKFEKIINPSSKMLFDMGNFYKNSKKYNKAIEYYSKIISTLDDTSYIKADLLYRRGGSYERMTNFKKADEDLLHSLKINPDDAYVLNYLAYSWLERDYKIDEAIKMLEKAYLQEKDDPFIIDSIGWAYYLTSNYIEAEKYLKRAVELMPDDPVVSDHYGDILWKLNRKIQARYFWFNALALQDVEEEMKKKINTKLIKGL